MFVFLRVVSWSYNWLSNTDILAMEFRDLFGRWVNISFSLKSSCTIFWLLLPWCIDSIFINVKLDICYFFSTRRGNHGSWKFHRNNTIMAYLSFRDGWWYWGMFEIPNECASYFLKDFCEIPIIIARVFFEKIFCFVELKCVLNIKRNFFGGFLIFLYSWLRLWLFYWIHLLDDVDLGNMCVSVISWVCQNKSYLIIIWIF